MGVSVGGSVGGSVGVPVGVLCYHYVHSCVVRSQAEQKLQEEEKRALKYLETRKGCQSVQKVGISG